MKSLTNFPPLFLILVFTSCLPIRSQLTLDPDFKLSIDILKIEPKKDSLENEIIITYQITNNSKHNFERPLRRDYYAAFTLKTKDGKEIGEYDGLYGIILAGQTKIMKEYVELHSYKYESIEASIYIR